MLNRELVNFKLRWSFDLQMAKVKVIVSDPTDGKSKVIEVEEARINPFIGKKLGETIDGIVVDMPATKLQILGGSDKDGVPMRGDVHGGMRRRVVLSEGAGFNPKREGERRRKTVRGNTITDEIVQINLKIVEQPTKKAETKKETPV
ncbi:MAG: 30S ribosomal protein S6e [Nitrososphaerota archaeon]|jgi:small subunit ribosomal protein S6e|nr:30S ribosomal protein S6e [Nitrososphaerota archaeon]